MPLNVLVRTFSGLGLASTICLPFHADATTKDLFDVLQDSLPSRVLRDILLVRDNGQSLSPHSVSSLSCLLQDTHNVCTGNDFLHLSLSSRLRGGKGGFGSQLRAAGGRMSSKKRKQNAEAAVGSARNLDGRRLRTITEAKNLATYLATKPDADRKEKEEKRKRWETIVELAEQREADMRAGKTADGRRKGLSSEWLEEKEEVGENVKSAVRQAMTGPKKATDDSVQSSSSSTQASADEDSDDDPMELDEPGMKRLREEAEAGDVDALWVLENKLKIPKDLLPQAKKRTPVLIGFDDDDDSIDDSNDENDKIPDLSSHSTKRE